MKGFFIDYVTWLIAWLIWIMLTVFIFYTVSRLKGRLSMEEINLLRLVIFIVMLIVLFFTMFMV